MNPSYNQQTSQIYGMLQHSINKTDMSVQFPELLEAYQNPSPPADTDLDIIPSLQLVSS